MSLQFIKGGSIYTEENFGLSFSFIGSKLHLPKKTFKIVFNENNLSSIVTPLFSPDPNVNRP